MAEAKSIVKLIVDNSSYKKGLSESEKEMRKFTSSMVDGDKQLAGLIKTASKFVAGLFAAETAIKAFKKMMDGSQTTADAFANTIYTCNAGVDNFFTSLSSGNWTNFERGISNMITRAYEASAAMDQLWNTMQSFGVAQALYGNEFTEALTDMKDTSLSDSQRQAAAARAQEAVNKQAEAARMAKGDSYQAAKAKVAEVSGLDVRNISNDNILAAALLDASKNRGREKEKAAAAAKKFEAALSNANANEANAKYVVFGKGSAAERTVRQVDTRKAYNEALSKLTADDIKGVITNAYLELMSDEELQGVNQNIIQGYQADTSAKSMQRSLNRAKNSLGKTTTKGATKGPTTTPKDTTTTAPEIAEIQPLNIVGVYDPAPYDRMKAAIDGVIPSMATLQSYLSTLTAYQNSDAPQNWKRWEALIDRVKGKIEAVKNGQVDLSGNTAPAIPRYTEADIKTDIPASGLAQFNSGTMKVTKTSQELADTWSSIGNIVASAGQAMSAVGNKGFNIAGTIAQAVANILLSYTMALTQSALLGPIAWVAFATSGLATALGSVASIKQAASYAEGGIVPGADYRDGITARVSSGEMILNQADARKLYGEIHSGNFGGGRGTQRVVVTGENIYTALNNYGKRTGRGEVVFDR